MQEGAAARQVDELGPAAGEAETHAADTGVEGDADDVVRRGKMGAGRFWELCFAVDFAFLCRRMVHDDVVRCGAVRCVAMASRAVGEEGRMGDYMQNEHAAARQLCTAQIVS